MKVERFYHKDEPDQKYTLITSATDLVSVVVWVECGNVVHNTEYSTAIVQRFFNDGTWVKLT